MKTNLDISGADLGRNGKLLYSDVATSGQTPWASA